MSERPTPETDAFQVSGKAHYMACEFARNLERQRDEARDLARELRDALVRLDEVPSPNRNWPSCEEDEAWGNAHLVLMKAKEAGL